MEGEPLEQGPPGIGIAVELAKELTLDEKVRDSNRMRKVLVVVKVHHPVIGGALAALVRRKRELAFPRAAVKL
jgi:hypothetical protein